jgi:CRISPR-associated protein Csd1
MLLQRLTEYAARLDSPPPPLYVEMPVRYIISLDHSGTPVTGELIDTAAGGTGRDRRGKRRQVPQVRRSYAIKPLLLADKADYTLGHLSEGAKPERAAACHRAYVDIVERCADQTGAPEVVAVARFLHSEPLRQLRLPDDFDPGSLITFEVDGVSPVDLKPVQQFWAAEHDPESGEGATTMQCVICGEQRPVRKRLTGALKGIPGGQTAGTSLISANAPAFESYGLEASLVAPTCGPCGERFTRAANALLADRRTSIVLGDIAFLFWTKVETTFSFVDYLNNPKPEQVRELWRSLHRGGPAIEVASERFYATALSASGGRAVVRDWIDTTIADAQESVGRWFEWQAITGDDGELGHPLGIYALAAATVRDPRKELPSSVPRALLRTALTGVPLPFDLLQRAVQRARADQERKVTRTRAALIKLVWRSHHQDFPEDTMISLEQDHSSPAYQCGRLLAVLEEVQRAAIRNINATIVNRYYGSASTAPFTVFPLLLRTARTHLAKLERDRRAAHIALERRLDQIVGALDASRLPSGFPKVLTVEEQGLFALGYYQQRAHDRSQAREAAAHKSSAAAAAQSERGSSDDLPPLPPETVDPSETPEEDR